MSSSRTWIGAGVLLLVGLIVAAALHPATEWEGVDTAVVEKYASALGREAQAPLLNIQGDLLLFVFAVAGAIGGFVAGYCWRDLFGGPSKPGRGGNSPASPVSPQSASPRENGELERLSFGAGSSNGAPRGDRLGHPHLHACAGDVPVTLEGLGYVGAPTAVALAGLGLLANLMAGTPALPLALAAVCLGWLAMNGIAPGTALRRLCIPWYLATVAALTQLFLVGSSPLFSLGPLTGYAEGLARGLLLGSRVIGGSAIVLALSMTVPPTDLLGLALRLRVPPVLVEIAMLTYRYLFLLAEEAGRIGDAQAVRLGHSSWRRRLSALGLLAGMVLINAYDRAERAYHAMLVRGYTGAVPVGYGGAGLQWPLVAGAVVVLASALWAGGFA